MSFSTEGSARTVIDGQDVTLLSLEGLSTQLAAPLCLGAKLIYWHHQIGHFTYCLAGDKDMWLKEWRNLKAMVRSGHISSIKSADPLVVLATGEQDMRKNLYPMLLVCEDDERKVMQCGAYFLLKQSGELDLMDYTPYFYTSKAARDDAVAKLTSFIPTPDL